jgi:biopolymer transport protein ExbD
MKRQNPSALLLLLILMVTAFNLSAGDKKQAGSSPKELEVTVSKKAKIVSITVKGQSGYHCNTLYPWKLTVEGPADEKKIYKKIDAKTFSKEKVVFEVPFIKGQRAKMKMSVCNDAQCIMHTEELAW